MCYFSNKPKLKVRSTTCISVINVLSSLILRACINSNLYQNMSNEANDRFWFKVGPVSSTLSTDCKFRFHNTHNSAIIIKISFVKEMYLASTEKIAQLKGEIVFLTELRISWEFLKNFLKPFRTQCLFVFSQ